MQQRVAEFHWKDGRTQRRPVAFPLRDEVDIFTEPDPDPYHREIRAGAIIRHVFRRRAEIGANGLPHYDEIGEELVDGQDAGKESP